MKRLIEQEACEHGKWKKCSFKVCDNYNHIHRWNCYCPGGSSREVTVDYTKAAWSHLEVDYGEDPIDEDPEWAMTAVSEGGFAYRHVKSLIDLALGGES